MRRILVYLLKQEIDYGNRISKKINYTLSATMKGLFILEKIGFVKRTEIKKKRPKRREKYYEITEEGRKIGRLLIQINLIKPK